MIYRWSIHFLLFRSRLISSDENSNDDSSPFAYPLIWEAHHTASSSSSQSPSSNTRKPPPDASSYTESPTTHPTCRGRDYSTSSRNNSEEFAAQELQISGNDAHENHSTDKSLDKNDRRHEKVMNKSGSSSGSEHSSNNRYLSHCVGPTVTPSKSSLTPSPSNKSVFLTPSERFSR